MSRTARLVLIVLLAGCGAAAPSPSPTPTIEPTPTAAPTPSPSPEPTPSPTADIGHLAFRLHQTEFRSDALAILDQIGAGPSLNQMERLYEELGDLVFDESVWMADNPSTPCYAASWLLYERALEQMTDGIDEILAGVRAVDADRIDRASDIVLDGIAKLNESRDNEDSC